MNPVKKIIETGAGVARGAAGQGLGLLSKARHLRPSPKADMDDKTLKSKVESVLFRTPDLNRGDVNVTVVDRRVTLHGQVKNPAAVKAVEAAVNAIPEVAGVENRMTIKGSTSRKKPATRTGSGKSPRTTGQRVNREVKATSKKEPAPKELAAQRKGRQPAPLGADDKGGASDTGVDTPGAKVEAALEAAETTQRGSTKTGASTGTGTRTASAKASTKSASGS